MVHRIALVLLLALVTPVVSTAGVVTETVGATVSVGADDKVNINTAGLKDLMTLLAQVPKEQKRDVGQRVNAAKEQIATAFEARKIELASAPAIDTSIVTPRDSSAIHATRASITER